MVLIESSTWIDYLRGGATAEARCLRDLLAADAAIAVCDPIRMEVLAGARDRRHRQELHRLLARAATLPTTPADYESAALLYATCRAGGVTIRRLIDCLIAAVAIRAGAPVLHRDQDFSALSAMTPLVSHAP